jgi:lipoprotein-releasing system permease protein
MKVHCNKARICHAPARLFPAPPSRGAFRGAAESGGLMQGSTRPFSRFEWMLAARYMRPKRKEGFISVITIISLVGIALGVATIIIVMSVMNGFRSELLSRILGFSGHMSVTAGANGLTDYDKIAARVRCVPGVVSV